jgi:hypothetical protein
MEPHFAKRTGIMPKRRSAPESPPFIYRSTYLHEADLVANEFERLGIGFYRSEEGPAGVKWAMPLSPAWEPGTCFLVIVPGPHARRAKLIVKRLPVSRDKYPGVWQPGMSESDKQMWRTWAWASLAVFVVGLIAAIVSMLRG